MKLSKNFSLHEMLKSNTAERLNIEQQYKPSEEIVDNLRLLCTYLLQPLREQLGKPIRINSGYRCKELNIEVGGAKNSEHLYGYAADIICKHNGHLALLLLVNGLPFTQLILEYGADGNPEWLHVSFNKFSLRREILRKDKDGYRSMTRTEVLNWVLNGGEL